MDPADCMSILAFRAAGRLRTYVCKGTLAAWAGRLHVSVRNPRYLECGAGKRRDTRNLGRADDCLPISGFTQLPSRSGHCCNGGLPWQAVSSGGELHGCVRAAMEYGSLHLQPTLEASQSPIKNGNRTQTVDSLRKRKERKTP